MKKLIAAVVLVISIVCFSGIAFAVTAITQTNLWPVKITAPGSYQLVHNLIVPNANTTAILVTADNVTIDLNGYAILGPTVCTGAGATLVCTPTGTGIGIDAGNHDNLKVYNGTVKGMGNDGIKARNGAIIESVRVASNGNDGIFILAGTVSGSTVTGNGHNGIDVDDRGTVSGNTVSNNGVEGIGVSIGVVNGNTVSGNDIGLGLGFSGGYVNNVLDNTTNVEGSGVNLGQNLCGTVPCP